MTYPPDIQMLIAEVNSAWEALSGSQRLWRWFGLGRPSFCVLPRVLMHEMPEDWQHKMAKLLEEFDDAFPNQPDLQCYVRARKGQRFCKWPEWLLNYRHPDPKEIEHARCPFSSFRTGPSAQNPIDGHQPSVAS